MRNLLVFLLVASWCRGEFAISAKWAPDSLTYCVLTLQAAYNSHSRGLHLEGYASAYGNPEFPAGAVRNCRIYVKADGMRKEYILHGERGPYSQRVSQDITLPPGALVQVLANDRRGRLGFYTVFAPDTPKESGGFTSSLSKGLGAIAKPVLLVLGIPIGIIVLLVLGNKWIPGALKFFKS